MSIQEVATALQRIETVLRHRPDKGLHDDAGAKVRWHGGLRMIASHANGTQIHTDMPMEMGGTGAQVTPGWLLRAGLAACAASCIVMSAARRGVELDVLEVDADSRSDTRGMLGMTGVADEPVPATPRDVRLSVRIGSRHSNEDVLQSIVREGIACSPVPCAIQQPVELALNIEVVNG